MKILLGDEQVSPDKQDDYGRTPLSNAAWNGHDGSVKILLEREEASPDKSDIRDQTPLSCAASGGHEEVVKTLLGLEEVNPNRPDNWGQAPLMYVMIPGADIKECEHCYSSEKWSIPTTEITTAKHPSCLLLGMDIRKW